LYQAVLQRTGARPIIINPFDCATSLHAPPPPPPLPRASRPNRRQPTR